MPAHWCIYKLMFYIHLIKYLFCISEYKAMLIQLLICHKHHKYIYIYIYILYIYQKVPIRIPLKYRIDKGIGKSSNTVKTLTIPIPSNDAAACSNFPRKPTRTTQIRKHYYKLYYGAVECLNLIGWQTFYGVQLFSGKRTANVVPGTALHVHITSPNDLLYFKGPYSLKQENNQNPQRHWPNK